MLPSLDAVDAKLFPKSFAAGKKRLCRIKYAPYGEGGQHSWWDRRRHTKKAVSVGTPQGTKREFEGTKREVSLRLCQIGGFADIHPGNKLNIGKERRLRTHKAGNLMTGVENNWEELRRRRLRGVLSIWNALSEMGKSFTKCRKMSKTCLFEDWTKWMA